MLDKRHATKDDERGAQPLDGSWRRQRSDGGHGTSSSVAPKGFVTVCSSFFYEPRPAKRFGFNIERRERNRRIRKVDD